MSLLEFSWLGEDAATGGVEAALRNLGDEGGRSRMRRKDWGWFVWLDWKRRSERRGLMTGIERRDTRAFGLRLVVACGGAGNGCSAVGAVAVEGVAVATGAGVGGGVGDVGVVGVEGAGGVDDIDGAGVGAGIIFAVDGAGSVDDAVGAAAVSVVECVGIAVDGTRGRRGVSEIGGASSSVVDVEGMRYTLNRRK